MSAQNYHSMEIAKPSGWHHSHYSYRFSLPYKFDWIKKHLLKEKKTCVMVSAVGSQPAGNLDLLTIALKG